jgi:hypothetical protein
MIEQEVLNERLRQAASLGDLAALEQALEGGADARAHVSWALSMAVQYGHAECVSRLIEVSDPKAEDSYALRVAAYEGHVECVSILIPVSDPTAIDSEALRMAALRGHGECVGLLLPVSAKLTEAAGEARLEGHMEVAGMIEAFMEARALSEATQNAKMKPRAKSTL